MLEFTKLSLSMGKKVLLNQANSRIEHRYRVGLVGRNGTGKSSLIKLILGQLTEDSGSVKLTTASDDIAYLEQSLPQSDLNCLQYAQTGDREWHHLQQQLAKAEQQEDGMKIAQCHARLQEIDGYSIESRAATILVGLGFTHDELTQPVRQFSGGWQMRLQLARVLLSRSSLYLLDEPTNHLDINAIVWLEQWLNSLPATLLIISHDRDFLDNVCTHTLHLCQQKLKLYSGSYTAFMKQFQLQLEVQSREQVKLQAKRAHLQHFVDRFKAKASKAKQAQSRVKALEKLVMGPGLQQDDDFFFEFDTFKPIQGTLLNLDGSAGYQLPAVLNSCRLNIDMGDRIGIIGANGQGKTTLLKTLSGTLPILQGTVDRHPKIRIGYFSQQQLDMLNPSSNPMESLLALDPLIPTSKARQFLGRFQFSGERAFDPIHHFSGGEKARLALALLIYQKPNCLLLDEPTNHLDIQMREAFILALQSFQGSVILVSHDRHFVSSVVNEIWCVQNRQVTRFTGDLEDYKNGVLQYTANHQQGTLSTQEQKSTPPTEKKASRMNQKQIKKIEAHIEKTTKKMQEIETKLADSSLYAADQKDTLNKLTAQHTQLKDQLETLEGQWIELQT